jgi:hypothetical protein
MRECSPRLAGGAVTELSGKTPTARTTAILTRVKASIPIYGFEIYVKELKPRYPSLVTFGIWEPVDNA